MYVCGIVKIYIKDYYDAYIHLWIFLCKHKYMMVASKEALCIL